MGRGLDMLGASGDGLKSLYLNVHVEHIDPVQFKKKLVELDAPSPSAIVSAVVMATDSAPQFVIDTAIPMAEKELEKFGIKATIVASPVPPEKGGKLKSEFVPGAVVGATVVLIFTGIGFGIWRGLKYIVGA